MINPKVSVIVPIYNSEGLLDRCINSILNQTYQNYEIILINDGSTDNSKSICDNYALEYTNIIVINKCNGGVSSARNVGIEASTGEYIVFIDSDDYIPSNSIELRVKEMVDSNVDLVIAGYIIQKEKQESSVIPSYKVIKTTEIVEKYYSYVDEGMVNTLCNKLFKTSIIKDSSIRFPINISFGEDAYFNIKVISKTNNIAILNKSVYYYVNDEKVSLSYKAYKDYYQQMKIIRNLISDLFIQYKLPHNHATIEIYNNRIIDTVRYTCLHAIKFNSVDLKCKLNIIKDMLNDLDMQNSAIKINPSNYYSKIMKRMILKKKYIQLFTGAYIYYFMIKVRKCIMKITEQNPL